MEDVLTNIDFENQTEPIFVCSENVLDYVKYVYRAQALGMNICVYEKYTTVYKISVLRGHEDSSSNRKHFSFYRHVEWLNNTFEGNRN